MSTYNNIRDEFDRETLFDWEYHADHEHPYFAPKTFGALAEEARRFEGCTLSETEWMNSRNEDHGCHLIFNFDRLFSCLAKIKSDHLNIDPKNALSNATDERKRGIELHMVAEVERALGHFGKHGSLCVCTEHEYPLSNVKDLCAHLAHSHDYETEVIEAIPLLVKTRR